MEKLATRLEGLGRAVEQFHVAPFAPWMLAAGSDRSGFTGVAGVPSLQLIVVQERHTNVAASREIASSPGRILERFWRCSRKAGEIIVAQKYLRAQRLLAVV